MSDLTLAELDALEKQAEEARGMDGGVVVLMPDLAERLCAMARKMEVYRNADREAATYVESVICMRTAFTGDPPYVGWKGLGLALTEALDERDSLRAMARKGMGE